MEHSSARAAVEHLSVIAEVKHSSVIAEVEHPSVRAEVEQLFLVGQLCQPISAITDKYSTSSLTDECSSATSGENSIWITD